MFRRYRALIALFAIALQAIDGVVGALGHSHDEKRVCCEAKQDEHRCGTCSHHRHAKAEEHSDQDSIPSDSQPDRHDDCSLCRHFSQPVVTTAVTIQVVERRCSEAVPPPLVVRVAVANRPIHPARGPPGITS